MRDVGDALNLYLQETGDTMLMVDFGVDGNQALNKFSLCGCCNPFCFCPTSKVDAFLLSHFHTDHYNGFLNYSKRFSFKQIYLPRFPEMHNGKIIIQLFILNAIIQKNVLFLYVLQLILNNSSNSVQIRLLSQKDTFYHNERKYEVLWPPRTFKQADYRDLTKCTQDVIDEFEKLKKKNKKLEKIYESLKDGDFRIEDENGVIFFKDEKHVNIIKKLFEDNSLQDSEIESITLSNEYKNFNNKLQQAANRLSIAFRQEDNVLFLGDLEAFELNKVSKDLKKRELVYYDTLIAAHHGTHWGNDLQKIKCENCLISVGGLRNSKVKDKYRTISSRIYSTFYLKDIIISNEKNLRLV